MQKTFRLLWSQTDFRKRELRMKRIMYVLFGVNLLLYVVLQIKENLEYLFLYFLTFLLWLIISFCRLTIKMRAYHNFEYQLHKKHTILFVLSISIGFLLIELGKVIYSNSESFNEFEAFCAATSSFTKTLSYIYNLIFS